MNRFRLTLALLAVSSALLAFVSPEAPRIPDKVFKVANYGASGDGLATNTKAIQAAIDAANAAGGGIITLRNITATAAAGKRAGLIWGLPEMNATGIVLENVRITADKPFGIFNAAAVRLNHCQIITPEGVHKIVSGQAQIEVSP